MPGHHDGINDVAFFLLEEGALHGFIRSYICGHTTGGLRLVTMNKNAVNTRFFVSALCAASVALLTMGCGSQSSSGSDPLVQTESSPIEAPGRNVHLTVSGLRQQNSKTKEHRVCAIALNGEERLPKKQAKQAYETRLVCSSLQNEDGSTELVLKDVPYPTYIMAFHDENLNGIIDFATFDVLVLHREGPSEGVATVNFSDEKDWPKGLSRPLWIEQGTTAVNATLHYEDLPLLKTVKEGLWAFFFDLYKDWADELAGIDNGHLR